MKPFSPGSPIDDIVISRNTAANAGMTADNPLKAAMSRVWRRS